jgi:hypothetical protein
MGDSNKQVAKNSFRLPTRPITVAVQLIARPLGRSLSHVPPGLRVRNRLTIKTIRPPEHPRAAERRSRNHSAADEFSPLFHFAQCENNSQNLTLGDLEARR